MNENRERHETNRNTNKLHYILFWIYCQMIKCGYGHPQNNTKKRANTHTHTMRNNVQCKLSILLGIYMYNAMQMRKCHVSILITIYVIQTLTQTWYDPWNNEQTNWIMCIYAICLIYFSQKIKRKILLHHDKQVLYYQTWLSKSGNLSTNSNATKCNSQIVYVIV